MKKNWKVKETGQYYESNRIETMKLQSTDDTILNFKNTIGFKSEIERLTYYYNLYHNHAKFKKLPLGLWMFVPCNDKGEFLEEPKWVAPDGVKWEDYVKEYKQAKENVIFEGFEYNKQGYVYHKDNHNNCQFDEESIENCTIEDLIPYNLTITPNAVEKYKLK